MCTAPRTISIHALLAESDSWRYFIPMAPPCISIHALLAESDRKFWALPRAIITFLSTLSLRRATGNYLLSSKGLIYFYPRSPCGERLPQQRVEQSRGNISIHALLAESDGLGGRSSPGRSLFLSTLSLRRATSRLSINDSVTLHFYPRSPCGERPNGGPIM